MTANKWYCIAQSSTFDSSCGITIYSEGVAVSFTASVRFGSSSINIASCVINGETLLSVRLRETDNKWCVDLLCNTEMDFSIDVTDSPYWSKDNTPAGTGSILAVINNISKEFNTEKGSGDSLWEKVNVGTEDKPVWALRPKMIVIEQNKEGESTDGEDNIESEKYPVGILSDTFITAKGANEDDDSSLFSVLTDWSNFNADSGEVLSAVLGYDLKRSIDSLEDEVEYLKENMGSGGGSIDVSILEKYLTKSEAEKTYTPLTTFNTYKETTDKRLESLEAMFGWYPSNEERESIKANAGLWTDSFVTARGINGNLDGEVFVRLDRWEDYNADSDEGQVLSAKLGWELLQMVTNGSGSGSVDLTGYVKTEELNTKLQGYYTKTEVTAELSKYQTLISSSNKIPYSYISGTPTIPSTSNFLSINGGTINGDLRLQKTGENYGTYLRFGDSNYAYIAEINDDELTIKATEIHLNGSVFVNGVAYSGGSDVDLDNYVTFDDLDGYAETSWVSDNFLSLDGGEINGSLDVNGSFYATSITHGSDIRHKSILNDIAEDVDFIANAPLFNFTWDNDADKTPHLGTSAQYWLNTELCKAVSYDKKNDFYGLAYGELGVAMGILNARKIVSHEERIKVLEAENAALKTELNGLRRRIG